MGDEEVAAGGDDEEEEEEEEEEDDEEEEEDEERRNLSETEAVTPEITGEAPIIDAEHRALKQVDDIMRIGPNHQELTSASFVGALVAFVALLALVVIRRR